MTSYPNGSVTSNFRGYWAQTWAIAILPYIEQGNLWNVWNPTLPSADQPQVTGASLPGMLCPSDITMAPTTGTGGSTPLPQTGGDPSSYAKGNYGACYGGGYSNENGGNGGHNSPVNWMAGSINRGFFSSRDDGQGTKPYGAAFGDVIDGLSNTAMMGEILKEGGNGACRGCWGLNMGAIFTAYTAGNPNGTGPTEGKNGIAGPNAPASDAAGNITPYGDRPTFCGGSAGDKDLHCLDRGGDGGGGIALRSRHSGGAQAVFGDGSVHFLSDSIDRGLYRSLLTIQGKEVTSGF